jgi:2-desacetyl-2-hydroxyethyl bacteriochlorophyllide A dehydrogenase
MDDVSRAFWIVAAGRGEIREEPLSAATDGDVVVRTLYSGISRGTESLVFAGRVPETEYQRMRAPFQAGNFPWPVKYGYSAVGMVERGPDELVGRHVFVLHPHQTRFVVPGRWAYLLPDDVPPSRAVLAANLETAVNAVWDARPGLGDRVAIVGGGAVGCLVAWLVARIPGCRVELLDINPRRAAIAEALGVRFALPAAATRDVDLVFHASGSPQGLECALSLAGFEATIIELSWYGSQRVAIPLGEAFHARRLTLMSSQVGTVAASQRARWNTGRRMALALSLLSDPLLDLLVTGESAFDELPRVMADLVSAPGDTLCHRVRYS